MPRITAELNDNTPAGERVNHKRVARVMRAETTKLTTEREILQRAAKYFAGETRW